jgi:hypothetical protein
MSAKRKVDSADDFLPIWFQLKPSFYKRLKTVAAQDGTSMPEALTAALRFYEKALKNKSAEASNGASALSPGALSQLRWRKVPPEERRKMARELAEKRWAAKRNVR